MNLPKSHWLYRFAYRLRTKPDEVNLCQFTRAILLALICWPLFGVFWLCVVSTFAVYQIGALSVGYTLYRKDPFEGRHRCKRWPSVRGHRILPIWFIAVGLVVLGLHWLVGSWTGVAFYGACLVIGALLGTGLGWLWLNKIGPRTSHTRQLALAYLKARKQKVCPIIKFTDSETA